MQKKPTLIIYIKPITTNIYPRCPGPTFSFTSREDWLYPIHKLGAPWPQYFCQFPKNPVPRTTSGSSITHFCWISSRLGSSCCPYFGPRGDDSDMGSTLSPRVPQNAHRRAGCVAKAYGSLLKAVPSNKARHCNSVIRCPCFSKAPWRLPLRAPASCQVVPLLLYFPFYFQLYCSLQLWIGPGAPSSFHFMKQSNLLLCCPYPRIRI